MVNGIKSFDVALRLFKEGLCAEDVLEFLDSVFTDFQIIEQDYMESLSCDRVKQRER